MSHGSKEWPLVYVASPYTLGDQATNVGIQIKAGNLLLDNRIAPVVPTLNHFMQIQQSRHEEDWMQMDFAIVSRCDAVLRLPGESKGADREVALAHELGIPVFYSIEDCILAVEDLRERDGTDG